MFVDVSPQVRISLGMYSVFLMDWLTVFPREQVLVIRTEDYAANLNLVLKKTFDFLSLGRCLTDIVHNVWKVTSERPGLIIFAGPLSAQGEVEMINREKANTRQEEDKNKGPMLPITRKLLRDFYRPFNEKLADVLGDMAFLWSGTWCGCTCTTVGRRWCRNYCTII